MSEAEVHGDEIEVRFHYDGREFDGFCTPCGGFRKHKLGCPQKKPLVWKVLEINPHTGLMQGQRIAVADLWKAWQQGPSSP